jgi:SpoU rRNA methylase family enzyme
MMQEGYIMQYRDKLVTRRRGIVAAAAAATTIATTLQGCSKAAMLRVVVFSLLFEAYDILKGISVNLVSNPIQKMIDPSEEDSHRLSHDAEQRVREEAMRAGASSDLAVQAAQVVGEQAVTGRLRSGRKIWCQNNHLGVDVNIFLAEIKNNTRKEIGGQFIFAVKDAATGETEQTFWREPFVLRPSETWRARFSCSNFIRPGDKSIVLDKYPDGLSIDMEPVKVSVLPITANLSET